MHTYVHTYTHEMYIHTYIHTYIHAYIHIHTHIHTYIHRLVTVDHAPNKKLAVEPAMALESSLDAWARFGLGSFPEAVSYVSRYLCTYVSACTCRTCMYVYTYVIYVTCI
jgi:hypothetical protein